MEDLSKIAEFRTLVSNMSLEELETQRQKIQDEISRMILDSDLILKAAIVDALIKEKQGA